MAKGDVIASAGSDNAILSFQPASGVEICITNVGLSAANPSVWVVEGVLVSLVRAGAVTAGDFANTKLFINNTVFIRFAASGAGGDGVSYSGVQVK